MAAEYEVNIKINTKDIKTQLGEVDKVVQNIGKSKGGGSRKKSAIAGLLPSTQELKAADRGIVQLIDRFAQRKERAIARSNALNKVELRLNKQLVDQARKRVRLQGAADGAMQGKGRMAAENIDARARVQERKLKLVNKVNELEAKGLGVQKFRNQIGKISTQQSAKRFASAEKEVRLLRKMLEIDQSRARILRSESQNLPSSPIRGGLNFPGSPIANAEASRIARSNAGLTGQSSPIRGAGNIPGSPAALTGARRRKRLEQVALGAGFPLLFGGGAGSVAGGALGGVTGSFGAQIGLSALGQQADQLLASTIKTAESVNSVGGALDFLRERSLFSSKETEELARKLENQGDLAGVAALVTEELNDALGPDGIQKMQDLAEQTEIAKQQWGQLTTNLELLIAGPLAKFLEIVNATLGIKVAQSQFARSLSTLKERDPERLKGLLPSFQGAKDPIRGGLSSAFMGPNMAGGVFDMQGLSEGALVSFTDQMNDILKSTGVKDGAVPITEEDKKRFKRVPGVDKAAREEERLQKRLSRLKIERQKVLDISELKDKIAAAEQAGDKFTVIRLKGQQKLKDIEAKRLNDLAGITKQSKIRAINELAAAKVVAAQADTVREINELEFNRQENFEDTIQDLDHQLKLAQATTEEERERLRIEERIRALKDGKEFSDPQLAEIKLRMEALAEENNLINTFIRDTQAQIEKLNDPMFQVIELASTLGNAFSESFRGIIDGSMSAQQALANLFQRTADHFLDMAAQMIAAQMKMQAVKLFMNFFPGFGGGGFIPGASPGGSAGVAGIGGGMTNPFGNSSLFGAPFGLTGKALGGPVSSGRPYLVGERGPEMFVPGAQGNIVPNNAMGGGANVVVNVDASGSNVEGNADQASQLGKVIGIAVQQELVKQKRPGGLLAM